MRKYKDKSDAELIPFLQEDEEAFNEIYERYHRLVYFVAFELCQNDADAKDVMQDTFVKVRRAVGGLREVDKFKFWLNAVTVSRCKDLFKRNKYSNADSSSNQIENQVIENRRYMLPEKQLHFKSDQAVMHHFIDCLPQAQKEILLLKFFAHLSINDIAEFYDISDGTVKSRIHYAKQSLRGMIENYNQKDKNKPLNFEMNDAIVIAALAYAYHKKGMLFFKPKLQSVMTSPLSIISAATCIAVTSGVIIYQKVLKDSVALPQYTTQNENIAQVNVDDTSKSAYFKLMDWAACSSDMKIKSEEEIQEVLPYYQALKAKDDAYYKLLIKQNWVDTFEEICMK